MYPHQRLPTNEHGGRYLVGDRKLRSNKISNLELLER